MNIEEIIDRIESGLCASDIDAALVQKRLKLGFNIDDAFLTPRVKMRNQRVDRAYKEIIKGAKVRSQFIEANKIREDYRGGASIEELIKSYNKSRTTISKIIHKVVFYNPKQM